MKEPHYEHERVTIDDHVFTGPGEIANEQGGFGPLAQWGSAKWMSKQWVFYSGELTPSHEHLALEILKNWRNVKGYDLVSV